MGLGFKFKGLVFKNSSLRFGESGWGFRRGSSSALGFASVMVVSLSALACASLACQLLSCTRLHRCMCISVYLSIDLSIYLSIYLSTYLSIYICMYMYMYMSMPLPMSNFASWPASAHTDSHACGSLPLLCAERLEDQAACRAQPVLSHQAMCGRSLLSLPSFPGPS